MVSKSCEESVKRNIFLFSIPYFSNGHHKWKSGHVGASSGTLCVLVPGPFNNLMLN